MFCCVRIAVAAASESPAASRNAVTVACAALSSTEKLRLLLPMSAPRASSSRSIFTGSGLGGSIFSVTLGSSNCVEVNSIASSSS